MTCSWRDNFWRFSPVLRCLLNPNLSLGEECFDKNWRKSVISQTRHHLSGIPSRPTAVLCVSGGLYRYPPSPVGIYVLYRPVWIPATWWQMIVTNEVWSWNTANHRIMLSTIRPMSIVCITCQQPVNDAEVVYLVWAETPTLRVCACVCACVNILLPESDMHIVDASEMLFTCRWFDRVFKVFRHSCLVNLCVYAFVYVLRIWFLYLSAWTLTNLPHSTTQHQVSVSIIYIYIYIYILMQSVISFHCHVIPDTCCAGSDKYPDIFRI